MADAPVASEASEPAPMEAQKRRTTAAPLTRPTAPSLANAIQSAAAMTLFTGDGVQIGTKLDGTSLRIYRIDDGVETLLDTRPLVAGVIRVMAAVQIVPSDDAADVVAIETQDRSGSRWDAYVDGVHSVPLSDAIADATSATEVERRLEGLP